MLHTLKKTTNGSEDMKNRGRTDYPVIEMCICKQIGKKPQIRRQASLYKGVVEEIVCFTCQAWYPIGGIPE